uniref:Uncharacterized protein n=1 Tax=Rhizophagus irregularis (strain DAOM 181602 / DAOM 197198 / MUCL 43194) TaxID=747089 RepID=U9SNQ1_RHIID
MPSRHFLKHLSVVERQDAQVRVKNLGYVINRARLYSNNSMDISRYFCFRSHLRYNLNVYIEYYPKTHRTTNNCSQSLARVAYLRCSIILLNVIFFDSLNIDRVMTNEKILI